MILTRYKRYKRYERYDVFIPMPNIEVEVRSFVSKEKYEQLLDFFRNNARFVKEDYQETVYFDCEQDLRIQKNDYFSKIWMKKGKMHDDCREEIEVQFRKDDFEKLEQLFAELELKTEIKWYRKRFEFDWNDISVCLDYTKGYGYIIELEKMATEEDKANEHDQLIEKFTSLNVDLTPKEEFEKKFLEYKEKWRVLTEE